MRRHLMLLILVSIALLAGPSGAEAQPGLTVSSPQDGESINGTSVTVAFEASDFTIVPTTVPLADAGLRPEANRDGEGHVHFMLDLMPIIVWESTEPYTLTDVPPGEHTLMVELVNNDHSPLSPPVVQQIRFRSTSEQLLAKTGDGQDASYGTALILITLVGMAMTSAGLILRRKVA
jgi:hypothetical protein